MRLDLTRGKGRREGKANLPLSPQAQTLSATSKYPLSRKEGRIYHLLVG